MKKYYYYIPLIFLVVLFVLYLYAVSGEQRITPQQAKKLIEQGAKVVDVRTDIEWNLGHHPKAIHIPSATLKDQKILNKEDTFVVYCNTGQRARAAAETLKSQGYTKVFYIASSYVTLL